MPLCISWGHAVLCLEDGGGARQTEGEAWMGQGVWDSSAFFRGRGMGSGHEG